MWLLFIGYIMSLASLVYYMICSWSLLSCHNRHHQCSQYVVMCYYIVYVILYILFIIYIILLKYKYTKCCG